MNIYYTKSIELIGYNLLFIDNILRFFYNIEEITLLY